MRQERCSLEDAGALLGDDDVLGLRRELVVDAVVLEPRSAGHSLRRVETAPSAGCCGRCSWVQ